MHFKVGMSVCALVGFAYSEAAAQQTLFRLEEAIIASIHQAFALGQLTCTQLTKLYLDRIDAYDQRGPSLRAIITINPKAMETASQMDRQYAANPSGVGSLHCIPIILKDNFNTFDMPTTGGNISMKHSVPPTDAFTVDKMRKAGALILAKGNLQEFARGGMSISSLGGQVRNPLAAHPAAPAAARVLRLQRTSRFSAPAAILVSPYGRRPPPTTWWASARPAASSVARGSFRTA